MPYKDIENRRKAIRNHYKNNKAYYQKKSNKWKIDNTEKVRASRIRYQEEIKLKKVLDIIIDLKKESKEQQKEVSKVISDMRKIIFESIGIEDQKSIKKSSFTKILDSFLDIKENLKVTDGSNKDFYDKIYNPSLEVVKQSIDK